MNDTAGQQRRALETPRGDLERVEEGITESRKSPRRRIIAPLHRSPSDLTHRMPNAI